MPRDYIVEPSGRGGWDVTAEGGQRASSHHDTQHDALEAARRYAANAGGGQIRARDEHGHFQGSETVEAASRPSPPRSWKAILRLLRTPPGQPSRSRPGSLTVIILIALLVLALLGYVAAGRRR
jgi:hypothetical protein